LRRLHPRISLVTGCGFEADRGPAAPLPGLGGHGGRSVLPPTGTDKRWLPAARGMMGAVRALRVRVLVRGGLEVAGADTPRLGSRKARVVLKVLALARSKPVAAGVLADCVWP